MIEVARKEFGKVRLLRSALGFIAAMLLPALLAASLLGVLYLNAGHPEHVGQAFLASGGLALLVSAPTLVVGLLVHLYLLHDGKTSSAAYTIAGSLVALVVGVGVMFALNSAHPGIAIAPFGGAVSGRIFWTVRRPDRDVGVA